MRLPATMAAMKISRRPGRRRLGYISMNEVATASSPTNWVWLVSYGPEENFR